MVVILAIAAMGLNLCVGYTGLVSFGHGTWFGIGAYAAGLIQLHWFRGEIWLPLLLSMVVVAVASAVVGVLILRRRGVYFSLLTLALAALTYTIAFRWSERDRRRGRPRRPEARQHRAVQPRQRARPTTSSSR